MSRTIYDLAFTATVWFELEKYLKGNPKTKPCKFIPLQGLKEDVCFMKEVLQQLNDGKISFSELKEKCSNKKTSVRP